MKIDINYGKKGTGRIQPETVNLNVKGKKSGTINQTNSQTTQSLSRTKALVDAAIINQIAQNFIQKAISISSRLKGIAIDAQISGKVQGDELNDALAGIKSSLDEVGGRYNSTAVNASEGSMVIQQTGSFQSIPGINDELKSLNAVYNDMSAGKATPDLKKIDIIINSLTNKASAVENSYAQIKKDLTIYGDVNFNYTPDQYSKITQNISGQIEKTPQLALKSQGNLNNEFVAKLL